MATRSEDDLALDRAAVRDCLDQVRDPELDRSIVDLQYIHSIDIDGTAVRVQLRLPTAWCSPAFAWMMVTDARDSIRALPSVDEATVELRDHMHAREINRGVNGGLSFEEAFDEADDDLRAVRRQLDRKSRLRRQFDAMTALVDAGLDPDQVATLERRDVTIDEPEGRATIRLADLSIVVEADPLVQYIEKARETGIATTPGDRLFATVDGDPFRPEEFETVRQETRLAKQNMAGQAAICAGLHEARYDDVSRIEVD